MDNDINIGGMAKLMDQLGIFRNEDKLKVFLLIAKDQGITFRMIQKKANPKGNNKLANVLWGLKKDLLIGGASNGYFLTNYGQRIADLIGQIAVDPKYKEMIGFLEMKAYQSVVSKLD